MSLNPQTIERRLAKLPPLGNGHHQSLAKGACILEAVSFVAGEKWSDHPKCACPVISTFLRSWNDALPDDERDALLRPLIPRLIGTRGDATLERRRSLMAADWLIRVHTPAWLRLAKMDAHADTLAALPEITDMAQYPSLMPTFEAARRDADAAWTAALTAARDAARTAARDAAWTAALTAAGDAALTAAGDAALTAARDAVKSTRLELQKSALALVERMIEVIP